MVKYDFIPTREDYIEEIKRVADEIGYSPTQVEYKRYCRRGMSTHRCQLATGLLFNEAKRLAGIPVCVGGYFKGAERPVNAPTKPSHGRLFCAARMVDIYAGDCVPYCSDACRTCADIQLTNPHSTRSEDVIAQIEAEKYDRPTSFTVDGGTL
jgi:hypothetical protein